jgi:hypothetical protein
VFSSEQLIQSTAAGKNIVETVDHPGTDSAPGCGGNSRYSTTTTVSTVNTITPVINLNGPWAAGGVVGPIISVSGISLDVDMSSFHRPAAHGDIIDSSHIT